MEASIALLQLYFYYNNETKESEKADSDDKDVKEVNLRFMKQNLENADSEDTIMVDDIKYDETEIQLSATEELMRLIEVTKDISWQKSFQNKLEDLRKVPNNWNGYGSTGPNSTALESCQTILGILHEKNLQPSSIYPSAEEGVTITFAYDHKRGIIECYNDGDIISFTYQGDNPAEIREISNFVSELREEISHIEDFIYGR
jgi:hypothetical protein